LELSMTHTQPVAREMRRMKSITVVGSMLAVLTLPAPASAEVPGAIAAPGEALVAIFHAQGAQVYECTPDAAGKLAWQFREPIATLLVDGKTVGRHYAGPSWELADGSTLVGKVVGSAPGATPKDIPLLKLEVVSQRGDRLAEVTTIQRLNTKGGVADGHCERASAFLSVPYFADYTFYRKARWSLIPSTPDVEPRAQDQH
jgi:uncharacterized protein DUF3455